MNVLLSCVVCIMCIRDACGGQKRVLHFLELKFCTIMSHHDNGHWTWDLYKNNTCSFSFQVFVEFIHMYSMYVCMYVFIHLFTLHLNCTPPSSLSLHPKYQPTMTHHVPSRLNASSPSEARQDSPAKGSKGRQQSLSRRQPSPQLLRDHMKHMLLHAELSVWPLPILFSKKTLFDLKLSNIKDG